MSLITLGVRLAEVVLLLYSVLGVAIVFERVADLRRARIEEERGKNAPSSRIAESVARSQRPQDEAFGRALDSEIARLERGLTTLATIASTAPYVGLFGTVLGILEAFQTIARTGQTGAAIVAGGISQALVATAAGLAVAIPAVIASNALAARIASLELTIEANAAEKIEPQRHNVS
jgi:biopolymer transport protein ExbB